MREITKHTETRIYSRRELAELLGFEPLTKSKIIVEVHGDEVSVVQQDENEAARGGPDLISRHRG